MSKVKISSALAWSSLTWNADWTVSRLGPKACSVSSSGAGIGASLNVSTTIVGLSTVRELVDVGALGWLGGWELGSAEPLPAIGSKLVATWPLAMLGEQRVHSPELGKNPAQTGHRG